jgi:hypothetical protein
MNHAAILALLTVVCLTNSASQPPLPAKAVEVAANQEKPAEVSKIQVSTNSNQLAAEPLPISVKSTLADHGQNRGDDKKAEEDRASYDEITAYSTLALALITAALALFTYRLWSVTKRLVTDAEDASRIQSEDFKRSLDIAKESADSTKAMVETMKDTAKRELRAYIGIIGVEAEREGVRIKFINNGITPAHNAFMHAWASLGGELTAQTIRNMGASEREIKKAANKATTGTTIWKGIEAEMLINDPSMVNSQFTMFICGHISYDDVFGDEHEVCCQFRMEFKAGWKFTACLGSNTGT